MTLGVCAVCVCVSPCVVPLSFLPLAPLPLRIRVRGADWPMPMARRWKAAVWMSIVVRPSAGSWLKNVGTTTSINTYNHHRPHRHHHWTNHSHIPQRPSQQVPSELSFSSIPTKVSSGRSSSILDSVPHSAGEVYGLQLNQCQSLIRFTCHCLLQAGNRHQHGVSSSG